MWLQSCDLTLKGVENIVGKGERELVAYIELFLYNGSKVLPSLSCKSKTSLQG